MSRVAKQIVVVPTGVTVTIGADAVTVKGAKGALSLALAAGVSVVQENKQLQVSYANPGEARMRAGSTRAHLANMINGVTRGYDCKLDLVGVGYRAAVAGKTLNLTLGRPPVATVPRIPVGLNCLLANISIGRGYKDHLALRAERSC
jgi:large subunit ribosomal protein L6